MDEIPMGYEFEMARQAAQAELDEINDMLARRQEAAAPMPEWTPPARPDPPVQQRRSAAPAHMDDDRIKTLIEAHVAAAIRQHSGQALKELAEALGGELGLQLGKLAQAQKDQLREFEQRVQALEARLFELALRQGAALAAPAAEPAAKPPELRMVGFGGGDD